MSRSNLPDSPIRFCNILLPPLSPLPSPPSLAAIFYSPPCILSWRLLTPPPPPRFPENHAILHRILTPLPSPPLPSPSLPSQVINYFWALSANCIYRSCMCFEGLFDGRDESQMSNTVDYPSCETFMSLVF